MGRRVEWLGRVPGTLGASASVETSGLVPTLLLLGVLGLAIYGGVKAVGSLKPGRLQENPKFLDRFFGRDMGYAVLDRKGSVIKKFDTDDAAWEYQKHHSNAYERVRLRCTFDTNVPE